MNTKLPSVLQEIKNLVSFSCKTNTEAPSYTSLHKGLVKMYFGARKVEIDYQEKLVHMEIPVTEKDYTSISFDCQDLERFLSSCVRTDKKSLLYYQNVLSYYSFLKVA